MAVAPTMGNDTRFDEAKNYKLRRAVVQCSLTSLLGEKNHTRKTQPVSVAMYGFEFGAVAFKAPLNTATQNVPSSVTVPERALPIQFWVENERSIGYKENLEL
jgi:hypothetical protein